MGVLLQFFAAFAGSWGSFVMGLLSCWPSYTLDLYTHPNTTLLSEPMTEVEGSLVGSIPALGAMIGSGYCGALIDKIGRQKGGVVNALPYILGWAAIYLSTNSKVIIAARLVMGIPGGAFLVYAPMFISEVADDNIRGFLASGPVFFYCLGSVISYLFGWFLDFHTTVMANLACSVLGCVFCFLVVESPIFLVRQGRDQEALQAIGKYKSVAPESKAALQELSRIKAQVNPAVELIPMNDDAEKAEENEKQEKQDPDVQVPKKMSSIKLLFVSPSSKRAFLVVATHLTMQVFMGVVPVMVYAKKLFAEATPDWSSHMCSVLLGLMLASGAIITACVADKAGRRVLLITSSILVSAIMVLLGLQLQVEFAPAYVGAALILVFCICFNIGSGTVPYVLLAESFIPEVQGIASMLLIEWVWFLNFVIIAIFPFANKMFGIYGTFYIFAAVSVANAVIGFLWIPETKGLSNEQIQEAYLRRRK
ncbi:hypothetical protein O0L34_g10171 [Tuta absoluta]|nr:hypothetical protein O0L34_g10171 [Tuta absoluta]